MKKLESKLEVFLLLTFMVLSTSLQSSQTNQITLRSKDQALLLTILLICSRRRLPTKKLLSSSRNTSRVSKIRKLLKSLNQPFKSLIRLRKKLKPERFNSLNSLVMKASQAISFLCSRKPGKTIHSRLRAESKSWRFLRFNKDNLLTSVILSDHLLIRPSHATCSLNKSTEIAIVLLMRLLRPLPEWLGKLDATMRKSKISNSPLKSIQLFQRMSHKDARFTLLINRVNS